MAAPVGRRRPRPESSCRSGEDPAGPCITLFHASTGLLAPFTEVFARRLSLFSRLLKPYCSIVGVFLFNDEAFCFDDGAFCFNVGALSLRRRTKLLQARGYFLRRWIVLLQRRGHKAPSVGIFTTIVSVRAQSTDLGAYCVSLFARRLTLQEVRMGLSGRLPTLEGRLTPPRPSPATLNTPPWIPRRPRPWR